jgi:hypothetical protein
MKRAARFHVGAAIRAGLMVSALVSAPVTGAAADVLALQRPSVVPPPAPQFVVPPLIPPLRPRPAPDAGPKFVMPQVSPLPLPPAVIVKCGMTIIHGYATIDPKILIEKPRAPNGSKPVIEVKPAPTCQE